MPTTEKQLVANRRNALRSTGPRTEDGKRAVRLNALKHGILAREIIINSEVAGEDGSQFHDLLDDLHTHFQPSGFLEETLVEHIAVQYWRLRRVMRSEAGEISKALHTLPPVPDDSPAADVHASLTFL